MSQVSHAIYRAAALFLALAVLSYLALIADELAALVVLTRDLRRPATATATSPAAASAPTATPPTAKPAKPSRLSVVHPETEPRS